MLLLHKISHHDEEKMVTFNDEFAHATKQLKNKLYFEMRECIKSSLAEISVRLSTLYIYMYKQ